MNNSVFRKTMENIRQYKEIKLVTNRQKYVKYVIKPNFIHLSIFERVFCFKNGRTEIKMNKLVYFGQVISDLSKTLIFKWRKYGSRVKLCYMDTDRFAYETETKHFYKNIAKNRDKV